jgi:hypothetical protein
MVQGRITNQLRINTNGTIVLALGAAEARTDRDGNASTDRETGRPLWRLPVALLTEAGVQVVMVTVPGEPDTPATAPVRLVNLRAVPWAQGDRSGIAYRADEVTAIGGPCVDADGRPTVPLKRTGAPPSAA